jgi:hypothetical protein
LGTLVVSNADYVINEDLSMNFTRIRDGRASAIRSVAGIKTETLYFISIPNWVNTGDRDAP